ncbi:hypothetical protein NPIL_435711 [Nephila pilipes]|uniref:Uncharacterized protein n=1 Tax=Nephila pilipes TaxID=299642 RepID=A0A8X6PCU3_NEPPI|nr:hypothetical protein NPIL_435711 [Nephila pilipes]
MQYLTIDCQQNDYCGATLNASAETTWRYVVLQTNPDYTEIDHQRWIYHGDTLKETNISTLHSSSSGWHGSSNDGACGFDHNLVHKSGTLTPSNISDNVKWSVCDALYSRHTFQ